MLICFARSLACDALRCMAFAADPVPATTGNELEKDPHYLSKVNLNA
jgi:hypothetical protein